MSTIGVPQESMFVDDDAPKAALLAHPSMGWLEVVPAGLLLVAALGLLGYVPIGYAIGVPVIALLVMCFLRFTTLIFPKQPPLNPARSKGARLP